MHKSVEGHYLICKYGEYYKLMVNIIILAKSRMYVTICKTNDILKTNEQLWQSDISTNIINLYDLFVEKVKADILEDERIYFNNAIKLSLRSIKGLFQFTFYT